MGLERLTKSMMVDLANQRELTMLLKSVMASAMRLTSSSSYSIWSMKESRSVSSLLKRWSGRFPFHHLVIFTVSGELSASIQRQKDSQKRETKLTRWPLRIRAR